MLYIEFLSLIPLIIEINRIISFFSLKKESKQPVIIHYMFFIPSIIISTTILLNNYLFLDFIDGYRVQAYPNSTLYCYVSVYNDVDEIILPCEVIKEKYDSNTYYYINKIYISDYEFDLSEDNINIYTDKYSNVLLYIDGENVETRLKLINIKYKQTKDISQTEELFEYLELIIAIINIIYVIDCIYSLLVSYNNLKKYDEYFFKKFGYFNNSIYDTKTYIESLKENDKKIN